MVDAYHTDDVVVEIEGKWLDYDISCVATDKSDECKYEVCIEDATVNVDIVCVEGHQVLCQDELRVAPKFYSKGVLVNEIETKKLFIEGVEN